MWGEDEGDQAETVYLWQIIQSACHKYEIPASQCWDETVSDLMLMLLEPGKENEKTDSPAIQRMMCAETDKRLGLRAKLSVEQRLDLEDWKMRLTQ